MNDRLPTIVMPNSVARKAGLLSETDIPRNDAGWMYRAIGESTDGQYESPNSRANGNALFSELVRASSMNGHITWPIDSF